jgi:hypothetical protein
MMRLYVLAQALPLQPVEDWAAVTPMYLKLADGRIPAAEPHIADAFNLLNILATLIRVSTHNTGERLQDTINEMSHALGVVIDAEAATLQLSEDSAERWLAMAQGWQEQQHTYHALFSQWLAAQLALGLFPFAGLGNTPQDRLLMIAVRYATVRLGIMSYYAVHNILPSEADTIRIIQSLARFMDHLSDPTLSLQLYEQMGWHQPARLHGLLMMKS